MPIYLAEKKLPRSRHPAACPHMCGGPVIDTILGWVGGSGALAGSLPSFVSPHPSAND